MRKLFYSVAMSLDGFVSGPHGDIDWITPDPDIDFAANMRRFDAVVAGRRTYEMAKRLGPGLAMPGIRPFVISRTLRAADCPEVTLSDDPGSLVAALKAGPGKDIWLFGGGELCRSLMALKLVDTVEVSVMPVLLGSGTPLMAATAERARLRLVAHRAYPKTGTIAISYDVV